MGIKLKWSQQLLKRVNSQWQHVIPIAENPASSQAERVGALAIADRSLEYLLKAIDRNGDSVWDGLIAIKEIVPDLKTFTKARDIRNKAIHRAGKVRHKEMLLALLEYQRILGILGVVLEERIGQEAIRRNGAPILQRYLN
jgi:hypothetical protein